LDSSIEGAARQHNLMDGVSLAPGGVARRLLPPLSADNLGERLRAIRERRNFQALTELSGNALATPDKILARIGPALERLPEEQAAPAMFAVASRYARAGQWTLAREAFLLMVDRYPAHPLAADAYRWLVRYNSSSE